jgi:hypothetical protein
MYIMHLISVIVFAEDVYGHFCAITVPEGGQDGQDGLS